MARNREAFLQTSPLQSLQKLVLRNSRVAKDRPESGGPEFLSRMHVNIDKPSVRMPPLLVTAFLMF